MASPYEEQIATLRKQQASLTGKMKSSPTGYGGESSPTYADTSNQMQLRSIQTQIDAARDKDIEEKWFSQNKNADTSGGQTGVIGKAIDVLSRPLYAVSGAVGHMVGQGKGSLTQDVAENMKTGKRTMSDVLRSSNVPGIRNQWVAAPLGFALDVALDPVNWATAGTAALVPRAAVGLTKGGIKGLAKGVESSALQKASMVGKYTPFFKGSEAFKKMAVKSGDASIKYNEMIGKDVIADVAKTGIGTSDYRVTVGDLVKRTFGTTSWGKSLYGHLEYDNVGYMRRARIKDHLEDIFGIGEDNKRIMKILAEGGDPSEEIRNIQKETLRKMRAAEEGPGMDDWDKGADEITEEYSKVLEEKLVKVKEFLGDGAAKKFENVTKDMSEAVDVIKDPRGIVSADGAENALRLVEEYKQSTLTRADLKEILDSGLMEETGIKWYDDAREAVKKWQWKVKYKDKEKTIVSGKKVLDAYGAFITTFKRAKVGASPGAWTNAILGNPTMAWMAGVNILDPMYLKSINDAKKIHLNRDGAVALVERLKELPEMAEYMKSNRKEFARNFGTSPEFLASRKRIMEEAIRAGKDKGIIAKDYNREDVALATARAFEEASQQVKQLKTTTPTQAMAEMGVDSLSNGRSITKYDLSPSLVAGEFVDSKMANEMYAYVAKRAQEPGQLGYKILDAMFNKSMEGYERIDQTFRYGTFNYLSTVGVSEGELNILRRTIQMEPSDIIRASNKEGIIRYQIKPEKAQELASEIFLNYQAMPGAVKMLRSLPILGSPFASFMYGMTLKTGKTLAYNPAVFNKVTFGINDFGGGQTPLEKQSLESPYYSYLNDPTMLRVPFVDENPIYMNLANLLPYYSLNMFTPTDRPYKDTLPGALVDVVDKSPILDDPIGQVMFDYFILPMMLNEQNPIGSFGQPIYPKGATLAEKAGYAARAVGDTVVPGIAQYAGLVTPESVADYMPGYRWRQLAYAKEGKNPYGHTGKEPAASRTLRGVAATAGIPIQSPMNLDYAEKAIEDTTK